MALEFAIGCGVEATADWRLRFQAAAVVYGHPHIPRTTWHDGVRFEEVSLGYPREWTPARPGGDRHWDRVLFSAKESVYKAWLPLTRRWLDFEEAEIELDWGGRFSVRLFLPGHTVSGTPLTGLTGRWMVADGLVATSVTVLRVLANL